MKDTTTLNIDKQVGNKVKLYCAENGLKIGQWASNALLAAMNKKLSPTPKPSPSAKDETTIEPYSQQ